MIPRPPRSTLFPTRRSSDLTLPVLFSIFTTGLPHPLQLGGFVLALLAIGLISRPERADGSPKGIGLARSEEHTSELQSQFHLVCRLLLEKKKIHINFSHLFS